jgi:hypothetical protein
MIKKPYSVFKPMMHSVPPSMNRKIFSLTCPNIKVTVPLSVIDLFPGGRHSLLAL